MIGYRLQGLLLGFALAALTFPAVASASHFSSLGFGHDNMLPAGQGTGTICDYNDGCFIAHINNAGNNAIGVIGRHMATLGTGAGVFGETKSIATGATGVYGLVSSTLPSAQSAGVKGENNSSDLNSVGVLGVSAGGTGVRGFHTGSSHGHGVVGLTSSTVNDTAGVYGLAAGNIVGKAGVYGQNNSNAANAAGVRGENTHALCCGMGVAGFHDGQGIGIYGESLQGFAVSGFSPDNWSGYFQGSVRVVGNLQKNSGSFTIDHPLDPANKYLSHSFVESPDMKNVYDGVLRTDRRGFATVRLPRYFQALNRDFRYQLTSLSGLQDVAVAKEIANNRFTIQSERPSTKVSWQVTGIRKDRWANAHRIVVEETKKPSERGKYLNPELFGKPATNSVVLLPGMDNVSPRDHRP